MPTQKPGTINENLEGHCGDVDPGSAARSFAATEIPLLEAVLMDGVRCYLAAPQHDRANPHILQRQAEFWIMSTDTDSPFSFVNVCDQLGFGYAWLREQLLLVKQAPKKPAIKIRASSSDQQESRAPVSSV
ncbi:MAG TPA: hypothetical protein EYQ35_05915 [candidate division UBP10 bacterium]|nr:hypothetical protein [Candidatus Binatota bacterium]